MNEFPKIENKPPKLEKLFSVIDKEKIDEEITFRLDNEKNINGDKIPGEAFWLRLKDPKNPELTREGKLFIPMQNNGELVVFEPGMMGSGNRWMEQKYISLLLKSGYTFFSARHNGTEIKPSRGKQEKTDEYIYCPERIKQGLEINDTIIGGLNPQDEIKIRDFYKASQISLRLLADNFQKFT